MKDTQSLLKKAEKAKNDKSARPRRWRRLWPIYSALRGNGYSCVRAVAWLAREGAVPAGDEKKALNAFHVMASRHNKKDKS